MINLRYLNKAIELTDGNEFRLLYVIANTVSLKKEGHTRIYRDMLADKLNLSTKQITRLTNSLESKGLIKKDLVCERDKTVCYYSLNLDIIDQKSTPKLDKNVPLNNSKKDIIKEKELNNSNNIEIIDNNTFEEDKKILLNKIIEKTNGLDFNTIDSVKIPIMNYIGSTFTNNIDRLKKISFIEIERIKGKLRKEMVSSTVASVEDEYPF